MALVSLLFIYLIIVVIFIASSTFAAIVFFIASRVLKKKAKRREEYALSVGDTTFKKPKSPVVTKALGYICLMPLVFTVCLFLFGGITSAVKLKTSLAYAVFTYDFEQTEKLLEKGVDPDCTEDSNAHAKDGEATLLYSVVLDRPEGYYPKGDSEHTVQDRMKMAQLLIDYGADVNYRVYRHEPDYEDHFPDEDEPEKAMYRGDDRCGFTPLLAAIYYGEPDMVFFLEENGADLNAVDYCGFNAVDILADELNDNTGCDLLEYLLDNGVDPNHGTNYGQGAVWLARRSGYGNYGLNNEKIQKKLEDELGITEDLDYLLEKYFDTPDTPED